MTLRTELPAPAGLAARAEHPAAAAAPGGGPALEPPEPERRPEQQQRPEDGRPRPDRRAEHQRGPQVIGCRRLLLAAGPGQRPELPRRGETVHGEPLEARRVESGVEGRGLRVELPGAPGFGLALGELEAFAVGDAEVVVRREEAGVELRGLGVVRDRAGDVLARERDVPQVEPEHGAARRRLEPGPDRRLGLLETPETAGGEPERVHAGHAGGPAVGLGLERVVVGGVPVPLAHLHHRRQQRPLGERQQRRALPHRQRQHEHEDPARGREHPVRDAEVRPEQQAGDDDPPPGREPDERRQRQRPPGEDGADPRRAEAQRLADVVNQPRGGGDRGDRDGDGEEEGQAADERPEEVGAQPDLQAEAAPDGARAAQRVPPRPARG